MKYISTGSFEFEHTVEELRLVKRDMNESFSSDYALVQWAVRREVCHSLDHINVMRYLISRLDQFGSVDDYLEDAKGYEPIRIKT